MNRVNRISLMLALTGIAACGDQAGMPTSLHPTAAAAAAKNPPPPPGPVDVNVTTTVYNADAFGALVTQSDDTTGRGYATYSPIGGVHGSLTSVVSADGAWQLFIGNQTARTLHLMLADAGLAFANSFYYSHVEVASRCYDESGNTRNIQLLGQGASYDNCGLILDFAPGTGHSTTYKLAMGPQYAGTGIAMVTCNAVTGSYCTSWTIVPNDAAPNARVAILTAGTGGPSLDGKFYTNSFRIDATK